MRERGQRSAAQALRLLDDALRRGDGAPAEPALDEVDRPALEPRERRAKEAEEVVAGTACPGKAQQRRKRVHERRLREAELAVDRIRDAERAEHGLERRCGQRSYPGHDDPDLLGCHAAACEREHLLADELERAATPGSLEEADDPVEARRVARLVGEQRPLEVRERRRRDGRVAWRELLDRRAREGGEVLGSPSQCCEGRPARLVGQRDRDLRPRGQRLEQFPLGPGEILEAVGEDRLAAPGAEIGPEALDGVTAKQSAIPPLEPVELVPVAGVERAELPVDGRR